MYLENIDSIQIHCFRFETKCSQQMPRVPNLYTHTLLFALKKQTFHPSRYYNTPQLQVQHLCFLSSISLFTAWLHFLHLARYWMFPAGCTPLQYMTSPTRTHRVVHFQTTTICKSVKASDHEISISQGTSGEVGSEMFLVSQVSMLSLINFGLRVLCPSNPSGK